jgi:large subunit ribosomal protein L6
MSRLGKLPIELPAGTQAKIEKKCIFVKGPKGELKQALHEFVKVDISEKEIKVSTASEDKKAKAFWGLYRTLLSNMVTGVNNGFERKLEINGVGYRAASTGSKITLTLGFSHPVEYNLPDGVTSKVEGNVITISGIDKQAVGEVAAQVRKLKKPEPYKGKGIKYAEEIVRRKAGKTAGKGDKK